MMQAAPTPNVLLVVTDGLAYGDLACHGNPHVATPNLDRLHDQGARLIRYCSGPVCTPARAALMTGRHAYRTRAIDTYLGRSIIDPGERTLAHVLGEAGYACGLFGKWHLGDTLPSRPHDMGFDEALYHTGGGLRQPANIGRSSYFAPDLMHNGRRISTEGYCTDVFADAAARFMAQHRDQPFFCYLATNAPHTPLEIADQWVRPYRGQGLPETWARLYGTVTHIDHAVGRLLGSLDRLNLTEDTLVIFTSDHGPCPSAAHDGRVRFNAGLRGHKGQCYEGGIRTPGFFRWPRGLPAGLEIDRLANPIDLLPTLAAVCGAALPDERIIDGENLLPLLSGQTAAEDWPDRRICMQWHRGDTPQRYRNAANLGQRYKWYWPEDVEHPQLFDLMTDPAEQRDLAGQDPQRVAAMQAEYDAWFDEVSTTRGSSPGENFDPPRILLGDPRENPTFLTRQDWRVYADQESWADANPGFWLVDVVAPGTYRLVIDLPGRPRDMSPPRGELMLHLSCGRWDEQIPVPANCRTVACDQADLPPGGHRFEALLIDGSSRLGVWAIRVQQRSAD